MLCGVKYCLKTYQKLPLSFKSDTRDSFLVYHVYLRNTAITELPTTKFKQFVVRWDF